MWIKICVFFVGNDATITLVNSGLFQDQQWTVMMRAVPQSEDDQEPTSIRGNWRNWREHSPQAIILMFL